MGKQGCEYHDKYKSFVAPTEERKVVDKTGAGDITCGVFLAMLAEKRTPEEALKDAVKIATKSISEYGVDFLIKNQEKANGEKDGSR